MVDLRGVSFLGTSGLACLVAAQKTANGRSVQLHLTGADHRIVARPLDITSLRAGFDIHPTVDSIASR